MSAFPFDDRSKLRSITDTAAEHDAFITLLITIERALNRKGRLLALIDDLNSLLVHNLPFGGHFNPSALNLSISSLDHLDWVLQNLDDVNRVLDGAMGHLRNLYGSVYLQHM
jgi:hypothetical protein